MTDMILTSQMDAELVQHVGDDNSIIWAARVSTGNDRGPNDIELAAVIDQLTAAEQEARAEKVEREKRGLINYLVKHRHGSPFEHNSMTFRIAAPIFVFREFHRHRIGWSYNEVSGRYKKLDSKLYVYPEDRPMVQSGSSAHPDLQPGTAEQRQLVNEKMAQAYGEAIRAYDEMLDEGIANEVARAVLPVGLFSEMYATCNVRSLMSFLSLRVDSEDAAYKTKPQWEIQKVAEAMENEFARLFPYAHASFVKNGRVAP